MAKKTPLVSVLRQSLPVVVVKTVTLHCGFEYIFVALALASCGSLPLAELAEEDCFWDPVVLHPRQVPTPTQL